MQVNLLLLVLSMHLSMKHFHFVLLANNLGDSQIIFSWYVVTRIFKGRVSGTDFLAWNWGFGNKFLLRFMCQELKFNKKQQKWAWKYKKIWVGTLKLKKGLKWGVSGVEKKLLIKGGLDLRVVHTHITFKCEYLPG